MINLIKWLIITIGSTIAFLLIMVSVNFYIDTYGLRSSLFTFDKKMEGIKRIQAVNQHIFNPEYIFRKPGQFDSFIFGSSRTSVIDPDQIKSGRFYNMSYSQGLLSEHLLIIKSFLQRGVKIKYVLISLEEQSFEFRLQDHQNELIRIMHPDLTGKSVPSIFFTYYFRVPQIFELGDGIKLLRNEPGKDKFILNEKGLNLFWGSQEKNMEHQQQPAFTSRPVTAPLNYFKTEIIDEVFFQINELFALARQNDFKAIFFFNPHNQNLYSTYAHAFFPIKLRLAALTDYYDFSGLNSITMDDLNYYEESHYRYRVGQMIVKRIFGTGQIIVPDDFGVWVTRDNVREHIKKQQAELEKHLAANRKAIN